MSTQELLNTLSRYDSRRTVKDTHKEFSEIKLEKIAKIRNISKNELNHAKKLQRKSIDELKEIARLRRIKSRDKLSKEDLIITLLKLESNATENNFMKHFNNNTNDDTYDDKIRGKISDIRVILSRLGNIVTKIIEKKLQRSFMKYKERKTFQIGKKRDL